MPWLVAVECQRLAAKCSAHTDPVTRPSAFVTGRSVLGFTVWRAKKRRQGGAVAEEALLGREVQFEQAACGVVDEHEKRASRGAAFEPVIR